MDSSSDQSTSDALLSINSLKYSLPGNLSVVNARSTTKYPALSASHIGGQSTVYLRCESGSRYVDGRSSWVRLRLNVATATAATLSSGSIANIIRTVVVRSASGTEIDRVQFFNYANRNSKRWNCGEEFFASAMGSLQGFDQTTDLVANSRYYYIRLADLSGVFNTSKLLPSALMSGLQIELELESGIIAFQSTVAEPTYTVTECEIFLDTFLLSDSISRRLNSLASQGGLELAYETTASTFTTGSAGQDRFSINANLAVSRALMAYAVAIPNANLAYTSDSFECGLGADITAYQYRIGSSYLPNAPVQGSTDALIQGLHAWDKMRTCHTSSTCGVTYDKWVGGSDGNFAAVAATLERSSTIALSGVPVSQSRSLVLDVQYASAVARTIFMMVSHVKVCSIFLNSQVIKM